MKAKHAKKVYRQSPAVGTQRKQPNQDQHLKYTIIISSLPTAIHEDISILYLVCAQKGIPLRNLRPYSILSADFVSRTHFRCRCYSPELLVIDDGDAMVDVHDAWLSSGVSPFLASARGLSLSLSLSQTVGWPMDWPAGPLQFASVSTCTLPAAVRASTFCLCHFLPGRVVSKLHYVVPWRQLRGAPRTTAPLGAASSRMSHKPNSEDSLL